MIEDSQKASSRRDRSPTEAIYGLMCELYDLRQTITPELLAEKSGIKVSTIKDVLERLRERSRICRVRPGVYEPLGVLGEPRAISVTMVPRGGIKIEIGDELIRLVPEEARNLAVMLNGYGMLFAQVEQGSVAAHLASEVDTRVRQIVQRVTELEATQAAPGPLSHAHIKQSKEDRNIR